MITIPLPPRILFQGSNRFLVRSKLLGTVSIIGGGDKLEMLCLS